MKQILFICISAAVLVFNGCDSGTYNTRFENRPPDPSIQNAAGSDKTEASSEGSDQKEASSEGSDKKEDAGEGSEKKEDGSDTK